MNQNTNPQVPDSENALNALLMDLWITDPYTVKYDDVVPKIKAQLKALIEQIECEARLDEILTAEVGENYTDEMVTLALESGIFRERDAKRVKELQSKATLSTSDNGEG